MNGGPVIVTANLSVHPPPACSSVSFFLPFGNHSTWFGQLPHVHSSPQSCLNSSSSHLSSDVLKAMLQPPSDPWLYYCTSGVLLTAHKKAVPSHRAPTCAKVAKNHPLPNWNLPQVGVCPLLPLYVITFKPFWICAFIEITSSL